MFGAIHSYRELVEKEDISVIRVTSRRFRDETFLPKVSQSRLSSFKFVYLPDLLSDEGLQFLLILI